MFYKPVLLLATLFVSGVSCQSYMSLIFDPLPAIYNGTYPLPPLPYETKELEPFIDTATMEVHYNGHHKAYTTNLNNVLVDWRQEDPAGLTKKSLAYMLSYSAQIPEKFRVKFINQAGGYVNHLIYWFIMSPNPTNDSRTPPAGSQLAQDIDKYFGSFAGFLNSYSASAAGLFGSGWTHLVRNGSGGLELKTAANQDSVFMPNVCYGRGQVCTGVLPIDVWEHAYYLKHKHVRAEYVAAWLRVVDWHHVLDVMAAFDAAKVPQPVGSSSPFNRIHSRRMLRRR